MFVKVAGVVTMVLLTLAGLSFGQAFWDSVYNNNPVPGYGPPLANPTSMSFVCLYGIGAEQQDTFTVQPWHRESWANDSFPSVPTFMHDVSQGRFTMTGYAPFHNVGGVDYIYHTNAGSPNLTGDWWGFADTLVTVIDSFVDFSQYCTNRCTVEACIVIPYWGTNGYGDLQWPFTTKDYWQFNPVVVRVHYEIHTSTKGYNITAGCHEFGHSLGFPDQDHYGSTFYDWYSLGAYEPMSAGGFYHANPDSPYYPRPSFYNPQYRNQEGWLDYTTITEPLYRVRIHDLYTTGTCYQLPNSNPKDPNHYQYFLVTNHQKLGFYEGYWPGKGLMLWHVCNSGGNWGSRRCHPIDIEHAGGLADISGRGFSNPDPILGNDSLDLRSVNTYDTLPPYPKHPPSVGSAAVMFPGPCNNTIFDGLSNPSSNLYDMSAGNYPESLASHSAVYNIHQDLSDTTIMDADLLVNNWYGPITVNTTWGPGHYVITGDVTVNPGVTLTIRPGTTIDFYPGVNNQVPPHLFRPTAIYVQGHLIAKGKSDSLIVFRSNSLASTGSPPTNNDWDGIRLQSGSVDTLIHCQISDCYYGISANTVDTAVIDTNTISNCQSIGIQVTNAPVQSGGLKVRANRILDSLSTNPTYGVYVGRTNTVTPTAWKIEGNYIEMNTYGIYVSGDSMGSNALTIYRDTLIYRSSSGGATACIHLDGTKAAVRIRRCRIDQGAGGNIGIDCENRVWPDIDSTKMWGIFQPNVWPAYGIYINFPNGVSSPRLNIYQDSLGNFNTGVFVGNCTSNPPMLGNNSPTYPGQNNFDGMVQWYLYNWGNILPPTIMAQNNWWGSNPPNAAKFYGPNNHTPYATTRFSQPWICSEPGGGNATQSAELLEALLPTKFDLGQSYPNPANGGVNIRYALPHEARVSLKVYNVAGQLIRTLVSCSMPAGYQSVQWDGKTESGYSAGPGVYLYRMNAGSFTSTKKLVLAR